MVAVQRWSGRDLPPALRWQAVAFIRTVWSDIDGGLLREPYPASLDPTYYTVTHEDDLLLSMAATYSTSVTALGRPWVAACLGNVFTFPAARGRGLARLVVDAAGQDIRRSSVDVGALLCDLGLQRFYEGCGWEAVPSSPTVTADGVTVEALRMMLTVSDAAAEARSALSTAPMRVPSPW